MSKIGRKPVLIPKEVSVLKTDDSLEVKGPKGVLIVPFNFDLFDLKKEDNELNIVPKKENLKPREKALWGTTRVLLFNAVKGVTEGWQMEIILEGLGYTAEIKDKKIIFRIGYSHLVDIEIPDGIEVEIKSERGKNLIILKGVDKQKLGQFGSNIIKLRKRDSYKGKGFRWADEELKLKAVKKAVGA